MIFLKDINEESVILDGNLLLAAAAVFGADGNAAAVGFGDDAA